MKSKMKSKLNLFKVEDNQLKNAKAGVANPGDGSCGCGCAYAGNGGSSTTDNLVANSGGGLYSPGVPVIYVCPPIIVKPSYVEDQGNIILF